MEFFKKTMLLFCEESVKAAAVLLVAQHFPALLDRVKAVWVVVGGKLADLGWWMRQQTTVTA